MSVTVLCLKASSSHTNTHLETVHTFSVQLLWRKEDRIGSKDTQITTFIFPNISLKRGESVFVGGLETNMNASCVRVRMRDFFSLPNDLVSPHPFQNDCFSYDYLTYCTFILSPYSQMNHHNSNRMLKVGQVAPSRVQSQHFC